MELKGIKVGFVLTGSFCTFKKVIPKIKELIKQEAEVIPIMSYNSYNLDTKFGKAKDFINEIEEITGKEIIHTIQGAEPIGPKKMTDIMVIAPCSRKYYGKACLRYNRYSSCYGCKYSPVLLTGNTSKEHIIDSKTLIELDCDTVSEIFKKLKKTTNLGQAFEYKIDDNDYEKEIEELSKSDEFIDKIKMYRLKQNMTMKYLARQIGKHDEVYRQYELKNNDIQDYKIAENIIKILGIENILELPDYFKIMKKYSKKDIIKIVDKVGKKQFSQETNIPTSTIGSWKRTDINKNLSTYTYKKVVPFFNNHNISY